MFDVDCGRERGLKLEYNKTLVGHALEGVRVGFNSSYLHDIWCHVLACTIGQQWNRFQLFLLYCVVIVLEYSCNNLDTC